VFGFSDVAQHGFVAQHGDAHAFWLGAFDDVHVDDTEAWAVTIAIINVSETATLPNISFFLA
jgi:hypothetical protein